MVKLRKPRPIGQKNLREPALPFVIPFLKLFYRPQILRIISQIHKSLHLSRSPKSLLMIKNYLKIAWRNLHKHKVFSVINIAGLAVGIAACTIIFLYVQHELGYDQHNSKAERIVRVSSYLKAPENDLRLATGPAPLAQALRRELPEVESAVGMVNERFVVKSRNGLQREQNIYSTGQEIFSIFDFDFVEGSATDALKELNAIVINQSLAKKYFGNDKALGKTIETDKRSLLVTGVFKDRPENSDMKIVALLNGQLNNKTKWLDDLDYFSFVLFRHTPDLKVFSKKLASISATHMQPELNAVGATAYKMIFTPEMLTDVHFSKDKLGDNPKGERQYSVIFSLLAVFILLIALLNYINLTTARSFERAREIGIRKVIGAGSPQIIRQFLFESFLIIFIAWILGNILVKLGLPLVNNLLETKLAVNWTYTLLFTTAVLLVSFVLAGFYPALVMSGYKPVVVLKGRWQRSLKGIWLRKTVMIVQFAIAAALIMGTSVIYQQMNLLRNRNLGYNKDQLMAVRFPGDSTIKGPLKAFQNELKKRPEVLGFTTGNSLDLQGLSSSTTIVQTNGTKKEFMCNFFVVDPQYIPVFQMQLAEGRNFSDNFPTDKTAGFIVNEAFARSMGWKSALGKDIEGFDRKGKIIGVVKDFSYKSLHNIIEPLVLIYTESWASTVTMRIQPKDLPLIESLHRQYFPSLYFDYEFFDEMLAQYYKQDKVTMSLFNQFTGLAIFVSCLGLYGLVSLVTTHRSKEIGVRKILGATLTQLFSLLTRDFIVLVLVALTIALPLTALAMRQWLNSYAYHIQLNWIVFVTPVLATIFIALLVVSREVVRAALANPVKSLKAD
jgi:putative ABC transport system permease protein